MAVRLSIEVKLNNDSALNEQGKCIKYLGFSSQKVGAERLHF